MSDLPLISSAVLRGTKPQAPGPTCMFSFTGALMVVGGLLTTFAVLLSLSGGAGVGGAIMNSVIWGLVVNLMISGVYSMTCRAAPGSATMVLAGLVLAAALLMFVTRPAPASAPASTSTSASAQTPAKADTFVQYTEDDISNPGPNYVPTMDPPQLTHGPI